jgi:hypothetical protein
MLRRRWRVSRTGSQPSPASSSDAPQQRAHPTIAFRSRGADHAYSPTSPALRGRPVDVMTARAVFLWGLKRSGNHLLANWLFANLGGRKKLSLPDADHRQLLDGHCDPDAGVAFYNNCGRLNSRQFGLGLLTRSDFEAAMSRNRVTIFGIEDCQIRFARRLPTGDDIVTMLLLRDPLNNIASRLEGAINRSDAFRTDEEYVDLFASYCDEYLGRTDHLANKVTVDFSRFVIDREYRDDIATQLGLENHDEVAEVSNYGGGSSFAIGAAPTSSDDLMHRYRQHPVPDELLDLLLDRPAIRDACTMVFGYDLAERVAELRRGR